MEKKHREKPGSAGRARSPLTCHSCTQCPRPKATEQISTRKRESPPSATQKVPLTEKPYRFNPVPLHDRHQKTEEQPGKTVMDSTFVGGKRIRRSAGIPVSFLREVDDPNMKGVMLSSSGKHVIPIINAEAYASQKKENPPFLPQNESSSSTSDEDPVPEAFLCQICKAATATTVVHCR